MHASTPCMHDRPPLRSSAPFDRERRRPVCNQPRQIRLVPSDIALPSGNARVCSMVRTCQPSGFGKCVSARGRLRIPPALWSTATIRLSRAASLAARYKRGFNHRQVLVCLRKRFGSDFMRRTIVRKLTCKRLQFFHELSLRVVYPGNHVAQL